MDKRGYFFTTGETKKMDHELGIFGFCYFLLCIIPATLFYVTNHATVTFILGEWTKKGAIFQPPNFSIASETSNNPHT